MTENARAMNGTRRDMPSLLLSHSARRRQRIAAALGNGFLLAVTSLSTLAVLFIFYFIARDALPFFRLEGFREFFTSVRWYPSAETCGVRRAGDLRRQRAGNTRRDPGGRAAGGCGGDLPQRCPSFRGAPGGQTGDRDSGGHSLRGLRILRPGCFGAAAPTERRADSWRGGVDHRRATGGAGDYRPGRLGDRQVAGPRAVARAVADHLVCWAREPLWRWPSPAKR